LSEQAPAIQAQVAVEQAWEKARSADQLRGFDVAREASVLPACGKCQATLAAGAKFCAQCGTPSAPSPALAGPKFCAQCGGPVEPGARFCPGCGGKLT
jgi:RNA polymerase subunit RPABC4/transcription elongation factor Spt4